VVDSWLFVALLTLLNLMFLAKIMRDRRRAEDAASMAKHHAHVAVTSARMAARNAELRVSYSTTPYQANVERKWTDHE
jgi:hypothetical protein